MKLLHQIRRWIIRKLGGVPTDETVWIIGKNIIPSDGQWHRITISLSVCRNEEDKVVDKKEVDEQIQKYFTGTIGESFVIPNRKLTEDEFNRAYNFTSPKKRKKK